MSSVRVARTWALVALILTLLTGACAGAPSDEPAVATSDDPVVATPDAPTATDPEAITTESADAAFNEADVTFLQNMVPHHSQAVEMAELVADRTAHPEELGGLADTIIATQSEEIDTMNSLLEGAGEEPVDPSTEMGGMHEGGMQMGGMMSAEDMTALMEDDGDAFDQMFLTMMTAHHEGAIQAAETVLAEGQNTDVSTLAEGVIEAQQAEIAQMATWQEDWAV